MDLISDFYQYIKKRNSYIFLNNFSKFKVNIWNSQDN